MHTHSTISIVQLKYVALPMHLGSFSKVKLFERFLLKCKKFRKPYILCQSLVLSTTILNDYDFTLKYLVKLLF